MTITPWDDEYPPCGEWPYWVKQVVVRPNGEIAVQHIGGAWGQGLTLAQAYKDLQMGAADCMLPEVSRMLYDAIPHARSFVAWHERQAGGGRRVNGPERCRSCGFYAADGHAPNCEQAPDGE